MNERTNTLRNFAGITKSHFEILCDRARNRRASSQTVELGNFAFDYEGEDETDNHEFIVMKVGYKGKLRYVRVPVCNEYAPSKSAFIDWVNFTFKHEEKEPEIAILLLSATLNRILGYGITTKEGKGRNGYTNSYILGEHWGFVCIGGQNDTVLVMINGEGCSVAKRGWERRLHKMANALSSSQFRYTRIDAAHDLFNGEYTVDDAVKDYDDGLFGIGGRMPKIRQDGNWRNPYDTAGRTVYIGARTSGKYCRIYEKGKELGEKDSPWVRVECEWHNNNRIIPYDVLLEPGRYLAGAYPALVWLNKIQNRIKTKIKKEKIVVKKAIADAKHQCGSLILYLTLLGKSAEEIVKELIGNKLSKRFLAPDWEHPDRLVGTT